MINICKQREQYELLQEGITVAYMAAGEAQPTGYGWKSLEDFYLSSSGINIDQLDETPAPNENSNDVKLSPAATKTTESVKAELQPLPKANNLEVVPETQDDHIRLEPRRGGPIADLPAFAPGTGWSSAAISFNVHSKPQLSAQAPVAETVSTRPRRRSGNIIIAPDVSSDDRVEAPEHVDTNESGAIAIYNNAQDHTDLSDNKKHKDSYDNGLHPIEVLRDLSMATIALVSNGVSRLTDGLRQDSISDNSINEGVSMSEAFGGELEVQKIKGATAVPIETAVPQQTHHNIDAADISVASVWQDVRHPFARPHSQDEAFKNLALTWEEVAVRETSLWARDSIEETETALVKANDVETMRQGVLNAIKQRVDAVLPPAVLESPAAEYIRQEPQKLGVAKFMYKTPEVEAEVKDAHYLSLSSIAEANSRLTALADESVVTGYEQVIFPLSPLEAAQRTAAALSESKHEAVAGGLPVSVDGWDNNFYMPALRTAQVIDHEAQRGGLILGSGNDVVDIHRPNGVVEETFKAAVGMIQDIQDPKITLVFAVEQGQTPMPGRRTGSSDEIYGKLQISAVGVNAERFGMRMSDALRSSISSNVEVLSEAGAEEVTEKRNQMQLEKAVRWLTDPTAIGIVRRSSRLHGPEAPAIVGSDDGMIVDAEIFSDEAS